MKYLFQIFVIIILSSIAGCKSYSINEIEKKEIIAFTNNLINNPSKYESIIMNSKFVNNGDTISKFCSLKYIVSELNSCYTDGFIISEFAERIYRLNNAEIPILEMTILSKKLKLQISFIKFKEWKLEYIGKIGCGTDNNLNEN